MANIPQFVSKKEASTEAPAVFKRDEKVGVMGDANIDMSAGEQAGKLLSDFGERMIKVENANDESKADIESKSALIAHEESFVKNPDKRKALESADNELRQIGETASKSFRSPQARQEWTNKWGLTSVIYKHELQTLTMKEQVDIGRTNTLAKMDLESSNYINAQTEQEKLDARKKIEATMAEAVNLQLFTHEDGQEEIDNTIKNAETAIKDRKILKQRNLKLLAIAQKEAGNAKEQEYISMALSHVDKNNVPISDAQLIDMVRKEIDPSNPNPRVRPSWVEKFIASRVSPKSVGASTIDKDFSAMAEIIATGMKKDGKTKVSQQEIRDKLLDLKIYGNLSDDDYDILTTANEKLSSNEIEKKVVPSSIWLKGILSWADSSVGARDESKKIMVKNYLNRVLKQNEDPEVANNEATKDEIKRLLKIGKHNIPKAGLLLISADGSTKLLDTDYKLNNPLKNGI